MQTTAGSLALLDSKVPEDATVVAMLRKAGAIIFGKASLSEWENFRSMGAIPDGWSGRGGRTLNPYNLTANPLGSSTGSAVAVSANMVAVSLGGETDGSTVMPSTVNGVVGLKPTVGLVSRHGAIPISTSQDSIGPITRTVADAAAVLSAIAGVDLKDSKTVDRWARFGNKLPKNGNFEQFLKTDGLKGARIGVLADDFFNPDAPDQSAPLVYEGAGWKQAKATLQKLGATLINVTFPDVMSIYTSPDEFTVLTYEFPRALKKYLKTLKNTKLRTLEDIYKWNKAHPDEYVDHMEIWETATANNNAPEYVLARERSLNRTRRVFQEYISKHKIDAFVALTDSGVCSPAAQAGYPIITVPAGFVKELSVPYGLAFVGGPFSEPNLIKYAYAFEQATKARRPPPS